MSTPRQPNRLREYSELNKYYPRELVERDGVLKFVNEDGTLTDLNSHENTTIKDAGSVNIGTVNPKTGGSITIPDATTTKRGLVILSSATPKAAGTAAVGTDTDVARADHVHPLQTSVSGNAGTATKLANKRTIGLGGVTATAQEFDGSSNITITVTGVPATIVTGLADVATSGSYDDLTDTPTIPVASTTTPKAAGTANYGSGTTWARADHVHPLQTTVSGNAGTATKLANKRTIGLGNVTATAQEFDGSGNITIPITAIPATIITGLATVATSGSYDDLSDTPTIPSASSTTPKAAGTAAVGTGTTWARADHVHPLQTTVSGNAGSATKLQTARTIALSGAATGTATSFNGSANITIPVTAIDGSMITGTIPLSSIPKGAQERLIPVANDTARLQLTSDDAQNGDVVKVEDTGIMYYITDDTKLGTEDAFSVFTAGAASSVAWTGITGKPTFATVATSGSYNDLSNKPSLATVATSGSYNDLSNKPSIPSASSALPEAAGTASAGTGTTWARADHVHPLQTTVSGNAGSATKLANKRTIGLGNVTATAQEFDGSGNITIPITAIPATIVTGLANVATSGSYSDLTGTPSLATVATSGSYNDLSNKPSIPSASSALPIVAGTASAGTGTTWARADHVHPVQTTVSGNAGTATKLANKRTIGLAGVTATAQEFDGSSNITITVTGVPATIVTGLSTVATSGAYSDLSGKPSLAAVATSGSYDDLSDTPTLATVATSGSYNDLSNKPSIPSASGELPKSAGTASAGSGTTWSRADHVHPLQTTVSGNAGTATKLANKRTIGLGNVTATAQEFDGSGNITIPISAIPYSILTGTPTIPVASTTTPKVAASTAVIGTTATGFALGDHVHPVQTSVSGNAGTATKLANKRTINDVEFDGSANITISAAPTVTTLSGTDLNSLTTTGFYKAVASHGCTNTPSAVGTSAFDLVISNGSQILTLSDGLMYLRTSATGTWTPVYTGTNPSPHASISTSTDSTSTSSTLNAGSTFTAVDSVTRDANGHVTAINTKTVTMPANSRQGMGYATCSTAASTTAKTASLSSGTFALVANGYVTVRFTYAVPASATLNVASTGAKSIYDNGSAIKAGKINAGDTATFVYNGTYYYLVSVSSPSKTYTANISTTWTGDAAPYTQTVSISGITANDTPIVDVVPDASYDTATTQLAEYGKIYKITTAANSITVYATEKTETTVPIQLKCVKA